MGRSPFSAMSMLPRVAMRFVGVLAAVALLFSVFMGGRRYFFCAAMERMHTDPCCANFEPSVEDQVRAERERTTMTFDEDERCCEARRQASLPSAVGAAAPAPLEAPWVGVVPPPPPLPELALASLEASQREERRAWPLGHGPPIESAPDACARLSVFRL